MANPFQYQGTGQGFLTDYSPIAAAGQAFQSAVQGYSKAKDDEQKRLEMAAQAEALKSKADRDKFQNQLDASKEGMTIGDNGQLQPGQLTPKDQATLGIKSQVAQGQMAMAGRRLDQGDQRMGLQQQRFGETQSQNASKAGHDIDEDSVMKDMQTARYSLSRGQSLLNGKMPLTYNNLNAVQQDVINGMTKGGQSSEGKVSREMQESWIGNWNNLMAKAGKYGPDADIRKQDPGLYKQIQGLLTEVDSTIGKNMSDRVDKLSGNYGQSGNQKVQNVIQTKKQQYSAPQAPPRGMVPTGMVTAPTGMVQGGGQDPKIAKYAQDNGLDYAHAAQILKARGYNGQ